MRRCWVSRVGGGDVMIMTMAIGMSMRNHMSGSSCNL
jgi:hypothetical protein